MLIDDHAKVREGAKQTLIEQPIHVFNKRGFDTEAAILVNPGLINNSEIELKWQLSQLCEYPGAAI